MEENSEISRQWQFWLLEWKHRSELNVIFQNLVSLFDMYIVLDFYILFPYYCRNGKLLQSHR